MRKRIDKTDKNYPANRVQLRIKALPSTSPRKEQQYYGLFFIVFILACIIVFSRPTHASECAVKPTTDVQPAEVVRTVIDALRKNSEADKGIEQVYCFAAPSNKRITGPLERFTRMIKSGYGDMLNHFASEFEPISIVDSVARQRVWLETADGKIVGYLFLLGKQSSGEFNDVWMTEGVYRIDPSTRSRSI